MAVIAATGMPVGSTGRQNPPISRQRQEEITLLSEPAAALGGLVVSTRRRGRGG